MPTNSCHSNQRIFISDCEGPISKNDNAYELTSHFVPNGDQVFALVSKYDDILVDVIKKPNYKAGDTLRLILPFLKAYGATDKKIREFSIKNILLVPGAKDTLNFVKDLMPSFIVSTSYEQYIKSLCTLTGFPFENTYCTRLNLDKYKISKKETKKLQELRNELASLPKIEIPKNAKTISDFSKHDQDTLERLDEIFWIEIPEMESGRMLREVNPIGGTEKARAVKDIVKMLDTCLDRVMYVGDSITDGPPLKMIRENNGLAVSFNGNAYSIRESNIAVLSGNTIITSILAEVFKRSGKDGAIKLADEWNNSQLKKYAAIPRLNEDYSNLSLTDFPKVEKITENNIERLITESCLFRKTVRGEAIGNLG